MIDSLNFTSTRPYLVRAMYEWCSDNGLTPHVSVVVDESVQVPHEYVKNGEIVLNISLDATSGLKLGNEFIEFRARFAGVPREISVPLSQVTAIYARENGQGMTFPLDSSRKKLVETLLPVSLAFPGNVSPAMKPIKLVNTESSLGVVSADDEPEPPRPLVTSSRPVLKRVK
jgi:stringent starvation protein B